MSEGADKQVGVNDAATALELNPSTVSRQVARFVDKGWLVKDADGKFSLLAYKMLRAGGAINPLMARNRGGDLGYETGLFENPADATAADAESEDDAGGDGEQHQRGNAAPMTPIGRAQLLDKATDAQLKQLKLRRELGQLVSKTAVEDAQHTLYRTFRDRLIGVAGDLAPEVLIQARQDPDNEIAVKRLIETKIRECLIAAADEFENDADAEQPELATAAA